MVDPLGGWSRSKLADKSDIVSLRGLTDRPTDGSGWDSFNLKGWYKGLPRGREEGLSCAGQKWCFAGGSWSALKLSSLQNLRSMGTA